MNPHDQCTMNEAINGQQATIVLHVDDLKISHCDSRVADTIPGVLNGVHGKETPLAVMWQGALISNSSKQKINTKSSTEAEPVGVSDTPNLQIWARHCLDAQFDHVNNHLFKKQDKPCQDDTSAIKLEQNGKASSAERTLDTWTCGSSSCVTG